MTIIGLTTIACAVPHRNQVKPLTGERKC